MHVQIVVHPWQLKDIKNIKMRTLFYLTLFLCISNLTIAQENIPKECTIEGLSCEGCAEYAQHVLSKIKGVDSSRVDFSSKKAFIYSNGSITEKEITSAIATTNFVVLFDDESLPEPLSSKERKDLDIEVIEGGEKLDFKKYLAGNKKTIFDFYAEWCGPCKIYSPQLERLVLKNPDLALRKVDVVEWESDLAKQLTEQYKLPSLPFTLIFNEDGKLIGKVEGNNIEDVKKALNIK